jgi:peptidoglycan/LPS O-acetylase OafA/YrhL
MSVLPAPRSLKNRISDKVRNLQTGTGMDDSRVNYRPEIDGLRALAVVAVIINHFNRSILPSGYLGVDIFFVISGYVITASLASYR